MVHYLYGIEFVLKTCTVELEVYCIIVTFELFFFFALK